MACRHPDTASPQATVQRSGIATPARASLPERIRPPARAAVPRWRNRSRRSGGRRTERGRRRGGGAQRKIRRRSTAMNLSRERALDYAPQLERGDRDEAALHGERRAMAERVEIRGAAGERPPHRALVRLGRLGVSECGPRESHELKRVGNGGNDLSAVAHEKIARSALRRVDGPRYRRNFTVQLPRVVARPERAALHRRLDDDGELRKRRDEPIPLEKRSAVTVRARRHLQE